MATSSFTQHFSVDKKEYKKLLDIINNPKKINVSKVENHKEIKGKPFQ